MSSHSSTKGTLQASLLKCEASLTALQTAFSQARSEFAEVRTALDSLKTSSSSHLGRLDNNRSPWAWDQVTDGESPGLRFEYLF